MARTVDQINTQIKEYLVAESATIGITIDTTTWSKRNLMRLMCYVVALALAIFEQLQDVFKSDLESTAATFPPASYQWIRDKVFKFQYSETNPQVIQMDESTFSFYYPVINETLRTASRCSVTSGLANIVTIKVAKGEPPESFASAEVSALQGYINTIGIPGVTYLVTSAPPDKLRVGADVYYQGQYSSVILANVSAAITSYLAAIPFNGIVRLTDLEIAIKAVTGVNDVVLKGIYARADSTSFASAQRLVDGGTEYFRQWSTAAGYIVEETESGETFADTLNFISE